MDEVAGGYRLYHGAQPNRQGVITLTGYHPGPANPGTCGTKVCYNIFTGRALKPSVIPVPRRSGAASTGDTGRGTEAPGAGILPARAQSAYTQFWESQQSRISEQYGAAGYAETALKTLELFCASNLSLCGTSLFERIWAANMGQVPATAFAATSAPGARAGLSLAGLTCGGMSFSPSTRVLTASRKLVAISKLKPGEHVLAAGMSAKSTAPAVISMVLVHFDTDRYELKVRAGQSAGVITTTADHLFWDETERQWVRAAALHVGDRLRSADDQAIVVAGGHLAKQRAGWMWDLTVPGDHDF
jgi:hypothetical protein